MLLAGIPSACGPEWHSDGDVTLQRGDQADHVRAAELAVATDGMHTRRGRMEGCGPSPARHGRKGTRSDAGGVAVTDAMQHMHDTAPAVGPHRGRGRVHEASWLA